MASDSELPALVDAAKQGRISPSEFRQQVTGSYVFLLSPEPVRDLAAIAPVILIIDQMSHLAAFSSLTAAGDMTGSYPFYGKVLFRAVLASVPSGCGLLIDPGSITGFALSPVQIAEWREQPRKN